MEITFLCVGNLKEVYLKEGVNEYLKRLSRFGKIKVVEILEQSIPGNPSSAEEKQIMEKEGKLILSKVPKDCYVIVLDRLGKALSSEALASKIEDVLTYGKSHIVFIIGGSLGLPDAVQQKGDLSLSFSKMTFPHQLMRLMTLEQVYRSFKIINHETYHK